MALPDPRYTTNYSDYDTSKGEFFFRQNRFLLPMSTQEVFCNPGYQPKKEDKGYALTYNDYTFQNINYGPSWSQYVHTPFKTENTPIINN